MTNKTRLNRLAELYYMLKNHDKIFAPRHITFDLNDWATMKTVKHGGRPHCQTAACALGSAGFYEPFMKKGLKTTKWASIMGESTYRVSVETRSGSCIGFSAGSRFFKITQEESEFLFHPTRYSYKPKAVNVAMRVRHLYKYYLKNDAPFIKDDWSNESYQRTVTYYKKDKGQVPKRIPAKLTPTGTYAKRDEK
jgi:hypothetical protein